MTNITAIFANESFDPDTVVAMGDAYDLACRTLQNIGELEVDREVIASRILQAARGGEQDAGKLCERAIHGLNAVDYRQS